MAKSAKIMESTKGGICMKCLGPIEVGEMIAYQRGFGAMHVACPEDVIVEEHYEFVNLADPDQDPEFGVRVIRPEGAIGLEGQEVEFTTASGKQVTVELGELEQAFEQRHAIYLKAQDDGNGGGTLTEPGIYETPDGEVYRVKWTADHDHLYAQKLVEINADRALEFGGRVQIEFEFERGAMRKLSPEMKMPYEKAKELAIRYGRCIVCGRRLKAAESVEQGIGPVCRLSFRDAPAGEVSLEPEDGEDIVMPSDQPVQIEIEGMTLEVEAPFGKVVPAKTRAEEIAELERKIRELEARERGEA